MTAMKLSLVGILLALSCPVPYVEAMPEDDAIFELSQVSRAKARLAPLRHPGQKPEVIVRHLRPSTAVPASAAPFQDPAGWTPRRLSRPPPL
jgi:hypothetical protein